MKNLLSSYPQIFVKNKKADHNQDWMQNLKMYFVLKELLVINSLSKPTRKTKIYALGLGRRSQKFWIAN